LTVDVDAVVTNNIIVRNGVGVVAGTHPLRRNLIWGNSTNLKSGTNDEAVIHNPLFVSDTNARITHRSYARQAATDGSDLGAYAYLSDQTPGGLQGKLFENVTLPAGSHKLVGDLTVAAGVTLTLLPGATLDRSVGAVWVDGIDLNSTEVVVQGTLVARGTAAAPVKLEYGSLTRFEGNGRGELDRVSMRSGGLHVRGQASVVFRDSRIWGNVTASSAAFEATAIVVEGGTVEIARSQLAGGNGGALRLMGGTSNVHHNELFQNCNPNEAGIGQTVLVDGGAVVFDHNTVASNECRVAMLLKSDATVTNNIFAWNGARLRSSVDVVGIESSVPRTVQYNLFYANGQSLRGVISEHGVLTNPRFMKDGVLIEEGEPDLRLKASSPARGKGSDGSDLGSHPYGEARSAFSVDDAQERRVSAELSPTASESRLQAPGCQMSGGDRPSSAWGLGLALLALAMTRRAARRRRI
jgi:hypothetical protein